MVDRKVGVNVGNGVLVTCGVPVEGVVVGAAVLMTNKFGVKVGFKEKGFAVDCGAPGCVGVCRKDGMEMGNPLQPVNPETSNVININLFITPLQ